MSARFAPRILAAAVLLALAAACTKSESGTPAPETTSSAALSAAVPVASTAPAAEPPASAAPSDTASAAAKDADDAGHAVAEPAKTAAGGTSTAAASASADADAGAGECGTKPLPDCPLQAWMKAHANPPVMTNDLPALATALDKIVAFAPPGYTNWSSISKDGAAAARAGDLTAAKASCRSCHDQYKQKYKTEMRARKV